MTRPLALRVALALGIVAAAGLSWLAFHGRFEVSAIEAGVRDLGALAPLLFVGAFAAATVLFVPGSLFGLAGGLLFGPLSGTAWNLAGGTLGATIAFLAARFIAADWIAARAGSRLKTVLAGVEAEGWRFVALTRLVPIVPFNALNYVLGLTRIPLAHYVLATAVCMVPGAAGYAWLGYAGRAAMAGDSDALRYGALGLAALALVVFVPGLVRRLRQQSSTFVSQQDLKCSMAGGAVNIPLGELPHKLGLCKSPLVVVCRTDKRSAKAPDLLRASGVGDVKVLEGGMEAWSRADVAP